MDSSRKKYRLRLDWKLNQTCPILPKWKCSNIEEKAIRSVCGKSFFIFEYVLSLTRFCLRWIRFMCTRWIQIGWKSPSVEPGMTLQASPALSPPPGFKQGWFCPSHRSAPGCPRWQWSAWRGSRCWWTLASATGPLLPPHSHSWQPSTNWGYNADKSPNLGHLEGWGALLALDLRGAPSSRAQAPSSPRRPAQPRPPHHPRTQLILLPSFLLLCSPTP